MMQPHKYYNVHGIEKVENNIKIIFLIIYFVIIWSGFGKNLICQDLIILNK